MSQAARRVFIIGIGAVSPKHLSLEAIEALNEINVVLIADKGESKADLVGAREAICDQFITGWPPQIILVPDPQRGPSGVSTGASTYECVVLGWHAERARCYGQIMADLPVGATVGFLVWGEPAFYDSTIRVVDAIAELQDLSVTVIPGISAFRALAAAHRIVLHYVGMPIHVTTGRRLLDEWSAELGGVVVVLDGQFASTELAGKEPDLASTGEERLTTGEAARLLGCSRQHVVALCESGDLAYLTVGTHRRLRRADVEEALHRTTRTNRADRRSRWLTVAVAGQLVRDLEPVLARARNASTITRHVMSVQGCEVLVRRGASRSWGGLVPNPCKRQGHRVISQSKARAHGAAPRQGTPTWARPVPSTPRAWTYATWSSSAHLPPRSAHRPRLGPRLHRAAAECLSPLCPHPLSAGNIVTAPMLLPTVT